MSVGVIHPKQCDPWPSTLDLLQQLLTAATVVLIGGMNVSLKQKALGIYQDLSLAPLDLLTSVYATNATLLAGLRRLRINDGGTGLWVTLGSYTHGRQ